MVWLSVSTPSVLKYSSILWPQYTSERCAQATVQMLLSRHVLMSGMTTILRPSWECLVWAQASGTVGGGAIVLEYGTGQLCVSAPLFHTKHNLQNDKLYYQFSVTLMVMSCLCEWKEIKVKNCHVFSQMNVKGSHGNVFLLFLSWISLQ